MAELNQEELNKRKAFVLDRVNGTTEELKGLITRWINGEISDDAVMNEFDVRCTVISQVKELMKNLTSDNFWKKYAGVGRKSM
jgi:hypothetical protein